MPFSLAPRKLSKVFLVSVHSTFSVSNARMTSRIFFRPIIGAGNEEPLCYLLQVDRCNILLDCGWDDSFRVEQLEFLKEYVE